MTQEMIARSENAISDIMSITANLLLRVNELETAVSAWQNARQACIKPTISQDELSALAKAEAALAGVVIK